MSSRYREFLRRGLNRRNRSRLNNHDFTIICNNCVGGVICHELGEQFRSPTVNLFFSHPQEYIEFCSDLEYYLTCEFVEKESDTYPVGLLDGKIEIHFVHYKDFQTAVNKWKERIKRVNFNQLYLILVQRDGCTDEDILRFLNMPFQNKIVFAAEEHTDERIICIPDTRENTESVIDLCLYKNKFTGKRHIDNFDYVSWLNKKL